MRSKYSFLALIALVLMLGVLSPGKTLAVSESSILVKTIPENPAPFENTNIALRSFVYNLDTVNITWQVNGRAEAGGIGMKSFSLKAPASGQETTVIARVSLPEGTANMRILIRPSEMLLLWEAGDSHTPPFYRGRALPTREGEIKIVAMPEIISGGVLVNPKNMTYAWKRDSTNDVGGSGYGKNYFLYVNDYLDSTSNISVTAETVDQKYSSKANITVPVAEPKILFYQNDPEQGTNWDRALTSPFRVSGSQIIEAIPYFISPNELQNPRLIWSWFINDNKAVLSGLRKNLIPLQVESGVSGVSKLRLEITNRDKIFQNVSKEVFIEF